MTISHLFAPRCRMCGAFLSHNEREANLHYFSTFLVFCLVDYDGDLSTDAGPWIRFGMCFPCHDDKTPEPEPEAL